ncbi:hypothetical protein R9X47_08495 [Wukongibacter baidiensis]|uniref:hypothetical protein n=1 Tax=Wukongibacter baidiensis TaxID=1723361 RepID=UPI003D7FEDA2
MKIKNRRDIVIFIILIPIVLWLSLNFSTNKNNKSIPYSILNKGTIGASVIYEAMKELNYPVQLTLDRIEDNNYDEIQIVITTINNEKLDINSENIKNWIAKGGKLIFLSNEWEEIEASYGEEVDAFYSVNDKRAAVFDYKEGSFLIGDRDLILNRTLAKNTDGAYWILEKIDKWSYNIIGFNEFYQYSGGENRSLWGDIPKGIKFILYQIAFLIIAIIFYKGRRFGKPIPFYEEVERTENEYILSVASLYRQAGSWEVILESYYEGFLQECEKIFGGSKNIEQKWIGFWEEKNLPRFNKARKLYDFIENGITGEVSKKRKSKKYLEMISITQDLNKILVKRREKQWEALKRDTQKI